jgi:hypothetical protein
MACVPMRSDESADGLPDMKAIAFWREQLFKSRTAAVLPQQDKMVAAASDICMKVLTEWESRCTCPPADLTREERLDILKRMAGSKLCQACKRLHQVLYVWVEMEKITTFRQKMDAALLKQLMPRRDSRKADVQAPEQDPGETAREVMRAYHAAKAAERPRLVGAG